MSRLMSVAFTEQAVRDRTKTVTRRKGWWEDKNGRRIVKPGDRIALCRKVMGRKKGEPLERIAEVEVVDVRRELLGYLYHEQDALIREGCGHMTIPLFIANYFEPQGLGPWDEVTRIEWRYLDEVPS